jgi:hypothetical protein
MILNINEELVTKNKIVGLELKIKNEKGGCEYLNLDFVSAYFYMRNNLVIDIKFVTENGAKTFASVYRKRKDGKTYIGLKLMNKPQFVIVEE